MKKMKKVLALGACAAMLVTASVMGTLAFLTADETITNTFTVGKVTFGDGDGNDMLVEYKVDEDGKPVIASGASEPEWVTSNSYKLVSGRTYTKNPTLNVGANSEACYLYVALANDIAGIEADTGENIAGESREYKKIVEQMEEKGWLPLTGETYKFMDGDTELAVGKVYMYCGTGSEQVATGLVVDHFEDNDATPYTIFDDFKIGDNVDSETLATYAPVVNGEDTEYKTIRIAAFAVQQADEGMDTAAKAWDLTFGK